MNRSRGSVPSPPRILGHPNFPEYEGTSSKVTIPEQEEDW